jgi:hypothetical protein
MQIDFYFCARVMSSSTVFFDIASYTARFSGVGGGLIEYKIGFDFFTTFIRNTSHFGKNSGRS